ncbi:MAG: hypothetical protein KGR26_05000 [Cyanobacteria bacterium REEB65]|nr:hypothetical protein [Cyanobacteria bacterium REEB65]
MVRSRPPVALLAALIASTAAVPPAMADPSPATASARAQLQVVPRAAEPEALALTRITALARAALADISAGASDFGEVEGFGAQYGPATRGLLDTLEGEWALAGQIASIAQGGHTDRLVSIRNAMTTARIDTEDFVRDARDLSEEVAATTDAISFRQQQIVLYGHLKDGLAHDRHLYEQVLTLAASAAIPH